MADTVDVYTGDLWRWVDRLTRGRRDRVVRRAPGSRKGVVEYFDVPSLWTQLLREIASSSAGGGHGAGGTGSRSPLNLDRVAIAIEITDKIVDALVAHDCRPRLIRPTERPARSVAAPRLTDDFGLPVLDPDVAGRLVERAARIATAHRTARDTATRYDTASDLRQLAAVVVGTGDHDLITWWADQYRGWVARIETALGDDDESIDIRPVRGKTCPTCSADHVVREQPSTATWSGTETFHDPALVVQFRDGQVQHVTCRACGTGWWRGDGLDELTLQLARPVWTSQPSDSTGI